MAFILLKKKIPSKSIQLGAAVGLALLAGGATYYFAAEHRWEPLGREDQEVVLNPLITSAIMSVNVFVALIVVIIAKRRGLNLERHPTSHHSQRR